MSKISQESINQVAAATDIVDLVGSYFPLKRVGSNFRALCPFHNEKSPSFYLHPARQTFHCFGCGVGGGVFRFLMDYEHLDFPEAVRRLAQRAGITLVEELNDHASTQAQERKRLLDLHAQAAHWYHQQLLRSPDAALARDYLKKRGFSKEVAIAWQLGYAPAGWHALRTWAHRQGFKNAELIAAGLLLESNSREAYDRFRHRLIFPIRNDYGDVIAFSGRLLQEESSQAKYVNSPETLLFSKGKILFGIDKSKKALIQSSEAIVMEGQLDLITAFEFGFSNVVAPQGTAFSADQARLLKRFVNRVILCFDSDAAGGSAVERSMPALLAQGLEVRVAVLPRGEDPHSLLQGKGRDAFERVLTQAKNFFDYTIDRAQEESSSPLSPYRLTALATQLAPYIKLLPNPVLRETTSAQVALRLGISTSALEALDASSPSRVDLPSLAPERSSKKKVTAATELLCRLALLHPEVRSWLEEEEHPKPHQLDAQLSLLEEILSLDFSSSPSLGSLISSLSPSLQELIASWDLEKKSADPLRTAKELWSGFQIALWKKRQAQITEELRKPALPTNQILLLQQELLNLQQLIAKVPQQGR